MLVVQIDGRRLITTRIEIDFRAIGERAGVAATGVFRQCRELTRRVRIRPAAAAGAAGEPERAPLVAEVEDHAARFRNDLLQPLQRPAGAEGIARIVEERGAAAVSQRGHARPDVDQLARVRVPIRAQGGRVGGLESNLLNVARIELAGVVIVSRKRRAAVKCQLRAVALTWLGTVAGIVFSKTMIGSGFAASES